MTLVIGLDEAGYGPNLGPLVIGASVWRVAAAPAEAAAAVSAAAAACPWADSKRVYRAGAGLAALETAAMAAVGIAAGCCPHSWESLAAILGCDAGTAPERGRFATLELPVEASAAACEERAAAAAAVLAGSEARLVAVRCRLMQPDEFNRLLLSGFNKSDILSRQTLDLAATLRRLAADEPAAIACDRHGGRMRYGPLVARHFDEPLVRPLAEAAACSTYELPVAACRIGFHVGGESLVPVALASMVAKYVRELAMRAFNGFWSDRVPCLRGTAGYPVDAARWRAEAAEGVAAEGIGWDAVWRRA